MADAIWLVTGSSGEYSDRRDWNVAWFPTEAEAEAFAAACRAEDAAVEGDARYEWTCTAERKSPVTLDPGWSGYGEHSYCVERVERGTVPTTGTGEA